MTGESLSTLATAINRLDGLTAYVVNTGSGYRLAIQGEDEGESTILAAAMGAGLSQTEATTAMNNGYRAGETEGAWDFSTLS